MSLKMRSNGPSRRGTISRADPTSIRTRFATPVLSRFRRAIAAVSGFHSTVTSSPAAGSALGSHVPEYPMAVPGSRIFFARIDFARMWRREPSAGPTIGQSSLRPCSSTACRAASPRLASRSMYASISSNTIPGMGPLRGTPAVDPLRLLVELLRPPLQAGGLLLELRRLQPHARRLRAVLRSLRSVLELPLEVRGRRGSRHGGGNGDARKGFSPARLPREREGVLRGVRVHAELRGGPPHATGGHVAGPCDRSDSWRSGRERPRDLHGNRDDGAEDAPPDAGPRIGGQAPRRGGVHGGRPAGPRPPHRSRSEAPPSQEVAADRRNSRCRDRGLGAGRGRRGRGG